MKVTKLDRLPQAPGSSSLNPTVVSLRPENLLKLGKQLVDELGIGDSVDTLGRWMAHYVAELIQAAEMADGEERPKKLSLCADAILALWKHRHDLPNGKRPLEDFEPILAALKSLDLSEGNHRYFRHERLSADQTKSDPVVKKWLDVANALDTSARILIGYSLGRAATVASDKSPDWIALAKAASVADDLDLLVIRIVTQKGSPPEENDAEDKERKRIEDRIKRLEDFKKAAAALSSDLKRQLK